MFLSQHKLINLMVVIDNNKLESLDKTDNILSIEDLDKRLSGFNFLNLELMAIIIMN